MLLMLYTKPGRLEGWKQTVKGRLWDAAFQVLDCLPTSDLGGVEPFGFADGISQPSLDWNREQEARAGDQLAVWIRPSGFFRFQASRRSFC